MVKVAIVDFELGNLFSVKQACIAVGAEVAVTNNFKEIEKADKIILPGVGAFNTAMNNLKKLGLENFLIDTVASGKPMMGVCLGLQLLFEQSEEFDISEGLGILKGKVVKIPTTGVDGKKIKVPHVAWNRLSYPNTKMRDNSPLTVPNNSYFYFVHSYAVLPTQNEIVLTTTTYDNFNFCSSVLKDKIFAVQFHPEKSGKVGLAIYKKWLES